MTAEPDVSPAGNSVILLTPPGAGAIAVVRIVGERVDHFLFKYFTVPTRIGSAVHGRLVDGGQVIDDPLIARLSQKGADINLHGGTWLVQRVLDLAAREGFTLLETQMSIPPQAVDGVDELESELLTVLPRARTEAGVRLLLAQLGAWKGLLLVPVDKDAVRRVVNDRSMMWILNPPTVAIVGPPNVGKSSLANQLFGRDRSITADRPGTTRDWVGEFADIDGLPIMLIDTPGVRATDDPIEAEAIERATLKIEQSDLTILVDAAGGHAAARINQHGNTIKVINKMDLGYGDGLNTNAISGEGIDELRKTICRHFDWEPANLTKACCWTERQRKELENLLI